MPNVHKPNLHQLVRSWSLICEPLEGLSLKVFQRLSHEPQHNIEIKPLKMMFKRVAGVVFKFATYSCSYVSFLVDGQTGKILINRHFNIVFGKRALIIEISGVFPFRLLTNIHSKHLTTE